MEEALDNKERFPTTQSGNMQTIKNTSPLLNRFDQNVPTNPPTRGLSKRTIGLVIANIIIVILIVTIVVMVGFYIIKVPKDQHPSQNYAKTGRTELFRQPLKFRFGYELLIDEWSCIQMPESSTSSTEHHYLCTNHDIGLSWSYQGGDDSHCQHDLKCIATIDSSDGHWNDDALCLPIDTNIELLWSSCGPKKNWNCIPLNYSSTSEVSGDNYVCWKEH